MRIVTTLIAIHVCFSGIGQTDAHNLGFENTLNGNIATWNRTRFSAPNYVIIPDSIVKYAGTRSLRFTYAPGSAGSDGTITQNIPVDIIGSKLIFSFWAKQSNPSDTAAVVSLILSTDKGEKKIAVRGHSVVNAQEWTKFTREFNLDTLIQPFHHARINAYAKTKDSFWIDDLSIEIDGKNIYDHASFSSPAGEQPVYYTKQQISNLELLCKTWGFLKYYHPNVAAGKFSWDMELFRMIPLLENAKNNSERDKLLTDWIYSLGEITKCKHRDSDIPKGSYSDNIDLKWMKSSDQSKELQLALNNIFENRHQGDGYYVRYEPVKNLFFDENEYNWRDKNYPARKFRLQFLFRYWNTIQYFFPYKNIIGKNWNEVLHDFIPVMARAKDSIEYHIAMAKVVNSVNDSHSGNSDPILAKEFAALHLPITIKVIDDKAVVTGFYNDTLAALTGLQKGDIIESIDNKTIKEIINERIDLANGSNYPTKLRTLTYWNFITGGKDSVVTIAYSRDDTIFTKRIKRYPFSKFYYKAVRDSAKWKILDNNIGYVNMGLLEKDEVEFMMEQLENTKGIIFDIRNYPKGTLYNISGYLLEKEEEFATIIYPDLDYPGNFLWTKGKIKVGPAGNMKNVYHYKGKVAILVNETTQSHAEWTTMAFQTVPGAITIGSQTSGADGNASTLYLTGNYFSYLTGLGVFYPDGTGTQRTGVKIDIEVKPTAAGIKAGMDEVLEKAISVLNN